MLPKLICKFWIRSRFQFFSLMLEGPFFLEKCGPKNQNCFLWWNLGSNSNMQNLIVKLIFFLFGTKDTDGNKAKAGISKRGFKKAKHTKFSGKQTCLTPPSPPPPFRRALLSWNTRFEIHHFALLPTTPFLEKLIPDWSNL